MAKVKRKHKPPSRIRYEQSHPSVSFRVTRDVYELLKQHLKDSGGISFGDFVKQSLGLREPNIEGIRKRAEEEYQIWYFCVICGERVNIKPDGEAHKALIGYMKDHRWGHTSCHDKRRG